MKTILIFIGGIVIGAFLFWFFTNSDKCEEATIKFNCQLSDAVRFHIDHGCETIREDIKQFVDEDSLNNWVYAY